jgi:muramoyltetrapeptide carboxypeptidase
VTAQRVTLLKPPRLRPGATIGVAALSGPSDPARLDAGCAALEAMGHRVKRARNLGCKSGTLGLAGSETERAAAYRELVLDPEVDAILFARGGYGIGRLLDLLDPDEIRAHAKVHCGFSDVTALSSFLLTRCGLPSFHGPMVAAELAGPLDPVTAAYFPSMLAGEGPKEVPLEGAVLAPGEASGRLVGGCLSLLAAHVGSPEEFDYQGAILFFEDVNEEAYRIDRMLGTLGRAGRLGRLSGIVVGALSGVTFGGAEDSGRLETLLSERLGSLGIPVVTGLPCGHRGPNAALPVGAQVTLSSSERVLRFAEEIVA